MTLYTSWEQIAIRIALACIASLAIGYNRVRRTILLSRAYLTFDGDLEGNPHSPMALVACTFCFAGRM